MIHKLVIAHCLLFLSVGFSTAEEPDETPQESISKSLTLLKEKDFEGFYDSRCHEHLRKQVSKEKFVKAMQGPRGASIAELYTRVAKLIQSEADDNELIQRKQEHDDEYEFILVKVREARNDGQSKNEQWHLELRLENLKWKLADTD
jgi:hypothetical protein